jgi:hypothetical protein
VFHIMRMNSLYGIRTLETIDANPLRRLRHKHVSVDRPLRKVPAFPPLQSRAADRTATMFLLSARSFIELISSVPHHHFVGN